MFIFKFQRCFNPIKANYSMSIQSQNRKKTLQPQTFLVLNNGRLFQQEDIRYGVVANIARSHWSDPSSPGFDSLYRSLFLAFLPSVVHFYFC